MSFKASVQGEHLHLTCDCGGRAKVVTLTYDQFLVELRATCEKCGDEQKLKIANAYGFEGPALAEHLPEGKAGA